MVTAGGAGLLLIAGLNATNPATASPQAASPVVTSAAAAGPVSAWVVDGMTRLPRTAPVGSGTTATISAARGETEPYQVAVRANGAQLTGGDFTVSGLAGPEGFKLPAEASTRYREHYIPVVGHSPSNGAGEVLQDDEFADALLPFVDTVTGEAPDPTAPNAAYPYAVAAEKTQPFWVDVKVPEDAPAGEYRGTWTIKTDQGSVSGKVNLTVHPFTLPTQPTLSSSFGVWGETDNREQLEDLVLSYKVNPKNIADPTRTTTLVDEAGATSADLGYWSGAYYGHCNVDTPAPSVEDVRTRMAKYDEDMELYAYTADEIWNCPNVFPALKEYGRVLHEAGARHLVVTEPVWELMDDGTGRPAVDDWVLLPRQARELDPALEQKIRETGGTLWSYQALVQGENTPSWQLDFPPGNHRILPGFLNAAEGYSGLLYWVVNDWNSNPWDDPRFPVDPAFGDQCCFPGDGNMVFPGDRAGVTGVVPSMRLAWIREGVEDYEYANLYREAGGKDLAEILAPAAQSWDEWSNDGAAILGVRDQLAAEIVELTGGPTAGGPATEDPATDGPTTGGPADRGVGTAGTMSEADTAAVTRKLRRSGALGVLRWMVESDGLRTAVATPYAAQRRQARRERRAQRT
jgi:hypothetical protein